MRTRVPPRNGHLHILTNDFHWFPMRSPAIFPLRRPRPHPVTSSGLDKRQRELISELPRRLELWRWWSKSGNGLALRFPQNDPIFIEIFHHKLNILRIKHTMAQGQLWDQSQNPWRSGESGESVDVCRCTKPFDWGAPGGWWQTLKMFADSLIYFTEERCVFAA